MQFRKKQTLLIMVFFLLTSTNLFAQVSQKMDLNLEKVTIKSFFTAIESKTDYTFMYKNLDLTTPVTIKAEKTELTIILDRVLSPLNISYEISGKRIILKEKNQERISEDKRAITGTVMDERGEPIIGANVVEKGSMNGTITDIDGKFSLNVTEDASLQISYIGYIQLEISIGNQVNFSIAMREDSQSLDEIVVIGYGTVRKRDLTGSVSQINSDKFERVPATNIMQAVQGRLPGLSITQTTGRPGSSSEILVHGVQSINGTNSPIFVVDGSISENTDNINPQDIETFTVLKDASAVAIYGSRAANGVIVINTKRGNNGQQPTITFKTEQSVQQEGNLKLGFVNAKQWLELATEAYENAGTTVPWTSADLAKVEGVDVNWPDAVKRTGFLSNNNLSVAGGVKNSNYFISLNYLDNKGIIKDQSYDRINLRLNSDHVIRERIKFGNSINIYSSSQTTQREYDWRDTYQASFRETPLNKMYENGDVAPVINDKFQGRAPSPTWMLENTEIKDRYKGIEGNIYLTIDIWDGLKFTTRGSVEWRNHYTSNFIGAMDSYYNMEGSNVNQITKTNRETLHWIADFLLDYNKTFGQDHSVNALLGYSFEEQTYEDLMGSRGGTPSNDIRYLTAGDPATALNNNGFEEWAFLSVFGRAGYSYKDKYIFSGTLRRDGTSRLVGEKYGLFPSVSAAWRIAEESFMQQFNWLNELKLRASWGTVGNVLSIDPYGTATYLSQQNAVLNQKVVMGYTATNAVNTNLKWESTTKKNIGLDATFLQNTLYFVSDFYLEDTHDLLFQQPIATSVGLSGSPYVNAGHIRNTGIDFELGHRKSIGDWAYDVNVNLSHVTNKVIDLEGRGVIIDTEDNTAIKEGYAVDSFFGYRTNGLIRTQSDLDNHPQFSGNSTIGDIWYLDVDGYDADGKLTGEPDGKIDAADRALFGRVLPDLSYGISGSVSYKNWTLQLQLQGIQGIDKYMRSGRWVTDMFGGEANMEADYILDRYHPTKNPDGKYPLLNRSGSGNNMVFSDFWMIDGSYLSIRNINLNYKVPEKITGRIGVKDLNLYCGVQNLFTFGNEYAEISNTVNVPIPRTWTFGLKFSL